MPCSLHVYGHDSSTRCMVMVPTLAQLIANYDWKELHLGVAEVGHMAVVHSKSTCKRQDSERARITSETTVEQHKNELLELGGYRLLLPQCRSQRPAFVPLMADADGTVELLLYLSSAMCLSQQHQAQQALLGRMGLPLMAACFFKAWFDMPGECTYSLQVPRRHQEDGASVEWEWPSSMQTLGLPEAARCAF